VIEDKYAVASPGIDCESRLHLCHARCCSLVVELSAQDLAERTVEWDLQHPYLLKRLEDGYCMYLTPELGCGNYHHRPATCRSYDCRNDPRVWIDFEARIPAPAPRPPPMRGWSEPER
jgi:Fe-S-cluster containining protein